MRRGVGGDKEGWIHTGAANISQFARRTKCDEMTHHLCRGGRITVIVTVTVSDAANAVLWLEYSMLSV